MSDSRTEHPPDRHPVTFKRLVIPIEKADRVSVQCGIPLPARDGVAIDVYVPPVPPARQGCVVLVNGLPDPGARRILGCTVNAMASFSSWARAIAASGMVAVTYTTTTDPAQDLVAVVAYVRAYGEQHGIDASRCALWACSSHVPNALGLLLAMPDAIRCAVLCYGFMLDLDGRQDVADAQQIWHFANPAQGRQVGELPATALLVIRAGRETTPGVNVSIDAFVAPSLAANLPLTIVNHATGTHAFDLDDDSPATRIVVEQILAFLANHAA
jgi:hypothetical protein